MKKPVIESIIFDLDGTLAETRQDITDAVNYTRLRFSLEPLSLETISGFVGDGIGKLLERVFPDFNAEEISDALSVFSEYYSVHLADTSFLYPGLEDFLNQNHQRKMAVLSNKAQSYTEVIVKKLGLEKYFSIVIGQSDQFPRKPEPHSILHILSVLNVKPEKSIIVGDTKNDILAGKAAGIKTCAVTYGFRSRDNLAKYNADFMVDSTQELTELFMTFN